MANIPTVSYDETKPAGTRDINLGDDDIRELKTQIREIFEADHKIASSGQASDWGHHNIITLLVQTTIAALADAGKIYTKDVDGKAELHFKDEDGDEIQLTVGGVVKAWPYVAYSASNNGQVMKISSAVPALADVNRAVVFYIDSTLATGAGQSAKIRVPFAGTITRVDAYVDTAPTGASLIADVNIGGTSIWAATQANRVTIAAAGTSGSQTSFDTTAVAAGDTLTIDLDQVGSTVAGADLTIIITIKES